nr:unnamed protein product [Digitaria exilis]
MASSCRQVYADGFHVGRGGSRWSTLAWRDDKVERGMSIKATAVSLGYDFGSTRTGNGSSDKYVVTAALRLTDGALVVVDCVEGICVQNQTVLRQALGERIKPILAVNKLDRLFLELKFDGEKVYQALQRIVDDANAVVAMYADAELGHCHMCPAHGTVAFTAGLHGWGFTLSSFAKMYSGSSEFGGVTEAEAIELLWGENYYDEETKQWTSSHMKSATCKRGFVQFCYKPIRDVISACCEDDKTRLRSILDRFGVKLKFNKDLSGKQLIRRVMQAWLPAGEVLLDMLVLHLPSPASAQRYRVDILYDGPLDDPYGKAIRNCDPDGPLVVYIAKMIPAGDWMGSMYAFGRVFSGKVASGNKVRVICSKYLPGGGRKEDVFVKTVKRTGTWIGKTFQAVDGVPCGNTVALDGLDNVIVKTAMLTDARQQSVACRNMGDLPKLVKALERLVKTDPLVECSIEETGEHVVAGAGELHLEVCLDDLKKMAGVDILVGAPVVPYRETVVERSSRVVMAKSPNKHSRPYMEAHPLGKELVQAIEDGRVGAGDDVTSRAKILREEFEWDAGDAKKLWCFDPATTGPNLLVNRCKGAYYTGEIRDSVVAAFQEASKGGVLAQEPMHGVHFQLCDAVLHSDGIHRGPGQIIPTSHRAQLAASPRLMEPTYLIEIGMPESATSKVYKLLGQKRSQYLGTGRVVVKALLPVSESFQFTEPLRTATSGEASLQQTFHSWRLTESDPLEKGSAAAIVLGKEGSRGNPNFGGA